MLPLKYFLATKIFNGEAILNQYASEDYSFQSRDRIIDYKYVEYTITKNVEDPLYWWNDGIKQELYYQRCTLGKYLRKAYNKLTPAQITHICEKVKAVLLENSGKFNILEGDDIKSAYYLKSYVPNHGTLSNSCMRYLRCQKHNYFQIYADHAKLLIMTPKRGKRLLGRAILWPYNGSYLMDRVYSTEPYVEHQFYTYAKQMGYGILNTNLYVTNGQIQKWLLPDDNYKHPKAIKLEINLDYSYNTVPFIDSVCYMSADEKKLSTVPFEGHKSFILHDTEGCLLRYYGS